MSITYMFYRVSEDQVTEGYDGEKPVVYLEGTYPIPEERKVDLYKYGDVAFNVAHEIGELYGLGPLVLFTHVDFIHVKNDGYYFSPEKVQEVAAAFKKITIDMYKKAILTADPHSYGFLLENDGRQLYDDYFRPMMDLFIKAADGGDGMGYIIS